MPVSDMREGQQIRHYLYRGTVLVLAGGIVLAVAAITLNMSSPPRPLEVNPPDQESSFDLWTLTNLGLMISPFLLAIGGIYIGVASDDWLSSRAKH